MTFRVKFWGVRGSIACATPDHMRYGGNTSCIEVMCNGYRLILDAGTGIRQLGQHMQELGAENFHILLTHTHWDHINGFPFFAPAYNKDMSIDILAGHLTDKGGIQQVLSAQMDNPMFPIPLDAMTAKTTYTDFNIGDSFSLTKGVDIKTATLNHPNGASGYRIEHDGKSLAYITDTEHVPGKPDQNILALIEGADLVIYDSTYTEEEFPGKIGWGHSTWNEGVKLCRQANVKKLAIFHHDPDHDDTFMDNIAIVSKAEWDNTFISREGMIVDINDLENTAI
jgi:phosphoribosyl 1,2-cyclic phosphodiesterase